MNQSQQIKSAESPESFATPVASPAAADSGFVLGGSQAMRRQVCQAAGALTVTGLAAGLPGLAWAAGFDEGIDYLAFDKPLPTQTGSRIEVIEFFWFACPHCYAVEAGLQRWKKTLPSRVAFRKEHVAFRRDAQQQLFYTLEALKLDDQLANRVFQAIHDAGNPLRTEESALAWARAEKLDMAAFERAWRSPGVQARMREAQALTAAHAVDGVPRFSVNGRFATSAAMTGGSHDRLFAVLNHLIQKSAQKA